ncbi:quorum-sensing autoinducer 2 sensor kinase/phosphatase LuxQ [Vibrio hangzhouensis]|uniref:quorum-sensing autoinducer 2 sensor kinase/phosphatase LuxQ n=1 Tax=Vibrio hangzhouensis TaxID=462991 RepID=UPI001C9576AC|nr:quorum-sensing autoinducer 2 sensor kinase/phosphatase LuxQ [Vibrio hangzhouensis]MBY6198053.1 response regulator [Vibrio hangzhouensis]
MPLTDFNNRKTLATIITRTVVWVVSLFVLGVLAQTWHLSRDIVQEEVQRTSRQTSTLVVNFFDYRLASLQILQDSNAKSDTVETFFDDYDTRSLDYFFLREDNLEPIHSPDFRFITHLSDVIWDDGNALFYGFEDVSLVRILEQVDIHSNWNALVIESQLGDRHTLIRRTPVINSESGEVLGFLFVGIVLDDNAGLLASLTRGSNSDDVLLKFNKTYIASTISTDDSYTMESVIHQINIGETDLSKLLITETKLSIGSQTDALTVYSVQRNPSVLALRNSYLFWIFFSLVVITTVSFFTRRWLNRKVTRELAQLMLYTQVAVNKDGVERFRGSSIHEFNHIGKTLSNTFERLSEQEKLFQDLFNFSLSPIIVWTENASILQINPAAQKSLALFDKASDTNNDHFVLFVEQMSPLVKKANLGATLTGIDVPIGNQIYRWNLSAIQTRDDKTLVLSQGLDITKLVEAEKQSIKAREEAEWAAKARTDFLAKMSHEIRTPLNGILGISQLLKQGGGDPQYKEKIDVLCNSGEHLLAVLNDILDFSKIENGSFKLEKHSFKFHEVITALEGIFAPQCESKNIKLVVKNHLMPGAALNTDQVRLNQIIFNLVSNAIKFTHHGQVTISFAIGKTNIKGSATLSIVVEDTGIGILQSQLQKIFDPFIQSESTLTREYGGSGLGLAIVKNLVTIFNGDIQVDSQVGIGTRFEVHVPVETVKLQTDSMTEESAIDFDLFTEALNVLLVEDNHTNAFIAKAFCEKYGMNVMWAKDGQEALDFLGNMDFDLILMDNQLPSVSGIEVTKQVRDTVSKSVPIYACTADNLDTTRQAFFAAGADYVIVKPIKEKSLNEALKHFKQYHYH